MTQWFRAVGVSTGLSVAVGCAFAAALLVSSEVDPVLPRLSPAFIAELVVIAVFTGGLVGLPLGVLGGAFAGTMLRRYGHAIPADRWAVRGTVSGLAGGALGSSTFAVLLSRGSLDTDGIAAASWYFILGAVCGAVVGFGTGVWCARQVRMMTAERHAS